MVARPVIFGIAAEADDGPGVEVAQNQLPAVRPPIAGDMLVDDVLRIVGDRDLVGVLELELVAGRHPVEGDGVKMVPLDAVVFLGEVDGCAVRQHDRITDQLIGLAVTAPKAVDGTVRRVRFTATPAP